MLKPLVAIYSFLILFYLMSGNFYSHSERRVLLGVIILFSVIVLFVGPSVSKKRSKEQKVQVEEDLWKIGDDFHNDFSKVGSSEDYLEKVRPPIPMDFGSDPVASARAQLDVDLNELGLSKKTNIVHRVAEKKFTLESEGSFCEVFYTFESDHMINIYRTYTPEELRGKGLAKELTFYALEWAIEDNLKVNPTCWYTKKVIDENERFQKLLKSTT